LVPAGPGQKSAVESSSIRSTLCVELLAKLLHLPHAMLLGRVAPTVVAANQHYLQMRGAEHPGLAALLRFAQKNTNAPSLAIPVSMLNMNRIRYCVFVPRIQHLGPDWRRCFVSHKRKATSRRSLFQKAYESNYEYEDC